MGYPDPLMFVIDETEEDAVRMLKDTGIEFDYIRVWNEVEQKNTLKPNNRRVNLVIRRGKVKQVYLG